MMAMFRVPPYDAFPVPLREMLDQLLTEQWQPSRGGASPMRMNVYEEGGDFIVEAELPGVQLNQVDVSCAEDVVTIRARSEVPDLEYLHQELHTVDYQRQIALPAGCRFEAAEAEMDLGRLRIRIPKAHPQEAEKIRIQVTRRGPAAQTIEAEPGSFREVRRPSRRKVSRPE
jgi:HSP20 family protein